MTIEQQFKKAKQWICEPQTAWQDTQMLRRIKKRVNQFSEGREALAFLKEHNVPILVDRQISSEARFQFTLSGFEKNIPVWHQGCVLLNSDKCSGDAEVIRCLFHEIQHIKQYISGVGECSINSTVEDHCWFNRAVEADADSFAVEMCWYMKLAGDTEPWESLYNDSGGCFMAPIFEMTYENNPSALDDGYARRGAFDGWFFSSHNRDVYDEDTITNQCPRMRACIEAYEDYNPPKRPVTVEDIKKIGSISKSNYLELPGKSLGHRDYHGLMSEKNKKLILDYSRPQKQSQPEQKLPKI